jgi:hybrid cluster-associated redox disulfide protein
MSNAITKITKDTVIGELLQLCPEAEPVIAKYFGTACFTCPGVKMESIEFGAMMHNLDPNPIIAEINAILEKK